jgi:hypothetical protein
VCDTDGNGVGIGVGSGSRDTAGDGCSWRGLLDTSTRAGGAGALPGSELKRSSKMEKENGSCQSVDGSGYRCPGSE